MNERNEEVRLVGASGAGMGQKDEVTSTKSLHTLHNWGANVFRYFIDYSSPYHGDYLNNKEDCIAAISRVIDNVIADDMYLVISWSGVGNKGNTYSDSAVEFFTTVASLYPNDPHIIYEPWNEPESSNTWADCKTYYNKLIPAIRAVSPNAIILVGSPGFDSDVTNAINDPLNYSNIMYVHHLYGNSFSESNLNNVVNAINAGVPVFESEWGPADVAAKGNPLLKPMADAYVKFLKKYNISNLMFVFAEATGTGDLRFSITERNKWNEDLPDYILTINGKFMKQVISNNHVTTINLIKTNSEDSGHSYRSSEWKDKIVSIEFKTTIDIPSNVVVQWDLSATGDNSVIGYLIPSDRENLYKLIICANGRLNSPKNMTNFFGQMTNLETINFENFETMYLDCLNGAFIRDKKLEFIDLSNFNTDKVTQVYGLFNGCTNLKRVDFTGWHPKLNGMSFVFSGCENLEYLDLRNWDVSGVKSFTSAFNSNYKLKTLNISTWNPTQVTALSSMLYNTKALEYVDMSSFNFDDSASIENMLVNTKTGAKFKVKNQTIADLMRSTATNEVVFETVE